MSTHSVGAHGTKSRAVQLSPRFERLMGLHAPACSSGSPRRPRQFGVLAEHEVGRSAALDRRRADPAPVMPAKLLFYTWWQAESAVPAAYGRSGEGMGERKQLELRYHTAHDIFEVMDPTLKEPHYLRVQHADGSLVQPTELFVGAKIDVLGKPRTLMQASAETMAWIDAEGKRMLRAREALFAELSKFEDAGKAMAKNGFPRLYLSHAEAIKAPALPKGGGANLARLAAEIEMLTTLLGPHKLL